MKNLTTTQIRARVKNRNYTDYEWNNFDLWKYVDYKTKTYIIKWKIHHG